MRNGLSSTSVDPDDAPLVAAGSDHTVAHPDLDVEAQLAPVGELAQRRADRARRALRGGRDVLDADLEADRGRPRLELLSDRVDRGVLHDRDHPRRREHGPGERAAHGGQQLALDLEVLDVLQARLDHHAIESPPETLSVWPVTKEASSEAR